MPGSRNSFGVNDATDCYRTVGGGLFVDWGGGTSAARMKAYRAAGVRCRRFGDDLYVRKADATNAIAVDEQLGPHYWPGICL
jgi:hypothetical protein